MLLDYVHSVQVNKLAVPANKKIPLASTKVVSGLAYGRHAVEILNNGSADIFFGGSDVSATNGMPIAPNASRIFPVREREAIFLFSTAETSVLLAEYFA